MILILHGRNEYKVGRQGPHEFGFNHRSGVSITHWRVKPAQRPSRNIERVKHNKSRLMRNHFYDPYPIRHSSSTGVLSVREDCNAII